MQGQVAPGGSAWTRPLLVATNVFYLPQGTGEKLQSQGQGGDGETRRTVAHQSSGLASTTAHMRRVEAGDFRLAYRSTRDTKSEFNDLVICRVKLKPIGPQEHLRDSHRNPLAAINERMIGTQVVMIRRGHAHQIRMHVVTAKHSLWHRKCGLQQPAVAQTTISTEFVDHSAMDRNGVAVTT
jgi:hypothetical protein